PTSGATANMASPDAKVYRLRGLPAHLDRLGVARLIAPFLPDGKLEDITVASLALSCELWARNPTKTATVTLRKLPEAVCAAPMAGEWQLHVLALPKPLILDDVFDGLTPLNEVSESQHEYDCIVISGLASHPMGSWQPHGNDKSFMWIRDELPELAPRVRFILYGYDTKLVGSKSFQRVADLANSLIHELKMGGWSSPSSKRLIFLAHSLGGVVLKQSLLMLADSGVAYESILKRTQGAIFFGVPSDGMSISDIHNMLGDQPNKGALVEEISSGSTFLRNLEEKASGVLHVRGMKLFWAYETQTTPTVQIDANHSDMVKFMPGDRLIKIVADKIRDIITHEQHDVGSELDLYIVDDRHSNGTNTEFQLQTIIQSLRAPERDDRLKQIDERAGYSFEWAFEDPSIGLKDWLQKGDGIFWISGRPASGKSTLMKFLHNDGRTSRLLRRWQSAGEHVEANFFFHYRGNLIQKSFEGLLRGILSQILEQAPSAFSIFHPILSNHYQQLVKARSLRCLQLDVEELVKNNLKAGSVTKEVIELVLRCEFAQKLFRTMVVDPMRKGDDDNFQWGAIEDAVVLHRKDLLVASKSGKLLEASTTACQLNWRDEVRLRFVSLLADWLKATDLEETLLRLGGISNTGAQISPASRAQDEIFIKGVKSVVHRYHAREQIRQSIQERAWTLQRLEQALSQIIHQQMIDLDLCIFIDALDEHDGPPEFIAEFLQDMVKHQNSRTRLKVLFSSRPWNAFTEAFGHCPGFRIHEHTENDIREVCAHVIQPSTPGSEELLQLVDDIVEQAKGVFLWVKLVLHDLSKVAATAIQRGRTESLSDELVATLKNIPHDLIEYYSTIVERIPQSYRREGFCLLEVVAKGDEILLVDVPKIISCLNFSRASERERIISELEAGFSEDLIDSLRMYTGGLVEIYGDRPILKIQLEHIL
ncbi:hypothetical protein Trco_004520, partial [Trichoderma cornu-damae]